MVRAARTARRPIWGLTRNCIWGLTRNSSLLSVLLSPGAALTKLWAWSAHSEPAVQLRQVGVVGNELGIVVCLLVQHDGGVRATRQRVARLGQPGRQEPAGCCAGGACRQS